MPPGKMYEPYHGEMAQWMRELRSMAHVDVSIRAYDGLILRGKFYEYAPGAPVELMFHGYRGNAERDLCGGVQRCFRLGHSALLVDQRASGDSQGHVITFGIREHRDCLAWVQFAAGFFGPDTPLILTGISMGAATVCMAAGCDLPPQVVGVLADCGYSSPEAIIRKCVRQLRLPDGVLYPLIRLGAMLYGGFDPNACSPVECLKNSRVPVLFFHGEADDFVPCSMSRENFEACSGPKKLVTMAEAGHGMCWLVDRESYLRAMEDFGREHGWNAPASNG